MALVPADWSVDRETGNIRYIGHDHVRFGGSTPSYATVIDFHRWLQGLADDASYVPGDLDELDITDATPSERSTDNIVTLVNGFNIDATAAEHLYDGSIIQDGGNTIYDGIVNFGNADVLIQLIQNGAVLADDWWNTATGGLNADATAGISHRFMLLVRTAGADIDLRKIIGTCRRFNKTYAEFVINATARGNNVLALADSNDLNNATAEATVATWTTITLTEGYVHIDVNNDSTADEYFYVSANRDTYTINQFYERMKWLTRDGSSSTIAGLNGELFRGITHEIALTTPRTGTFAAYEAVSWSGGTGQMLAIDSTTAGTKMWIQLLTGVAPTDTQTITGASTATATASGTATERALSKPFCGASTGSALIGAYGFGVEYADLSASDIMTALDGNTYFPPNNVTFTVLGLVNGEDRVLVGPLGYRFFYDNEGGTPPFQVGETLTFTSPAGTAKLVRLQDYGTTGEMWIGPILTGSVPVNNSTISGGTSGATADVNGAVAADVNLGQFNLNGALTGAAVTSVVIATAIPSDTPSTGTIRIQRDSGAYTLHTFSARSGSTFTIASSDFSTDNASNGNNVFISYIDKLAAADNESFTVVYLAARDLFVRVRDGGASPIKTFETSASLGSGGGSATAIRTSDE
jgi:hypothetical protein